MKIFSKYFIVLLIFSGLLIITACNKSSKTLAEIGDDKITLAEFEKQYLKTVGNVDSARNKSFEEKRKFLDLYINFKLKTKDAREKGLLNNPDIQKDINEYKMSFGPNFVIDKEVVSKELKKLYERKKEEVRASHILLNLPQNATPQDSITAYQIADTIIKKLKDGADFGQIAVEYSNDRSVVQNFGDLYFFTGGMTVDEFEDAVYDLKVGEFTEKPVRTMFGLHIIKLTDRKPRVESIRASHVLIQDKRDSLGVVIDSIETYNKAQEVYNRARNNEDFTSLAQQYSDDPGTKFVGGDLGYFDRRKMVQAFDSVAFLMKVGDISEPIKTQYGWHIIKKTDEKRLEPFDKQIETLKSEYKRTNKYKMDYQKYVDNLKDKYDFKINDDGLAFLKSKIDSTQNTQQINLDSVFNSEDKNRVVASFKGFEMKVSDLLNHLNINRDYQRINLTHATIIALINSAVEPHILIKKGEDMNIEEDEEYKEMLTEYENGLLIFKVDQGELWSKVKINDAELQSYYESNKSVYLKTDSTGQSVSRPFDEVKAQISNELQQAKFKEIENSYLTSLRAKYPVKIYEDVLRESFMND